MFIYYFGVLWRMLQRYFSLGKAVNVMKTQLEFQNVRPPSYFPWSPVGEIGVTNLIFRFNTPDLKTLDLKPSAARDSEVHETPKACEGSTSSC